jgi:hypothetical protein
MLKGYLDWPGVEQVGRVERTACERGEVTVEVQYIITSVPPSQAPPATVLAWTRGHWGIENRLHRVRDVTLGEDANRTRKGSCPLALAALRNLIISKLRLDDTDNIAAALRRNAARVRELFVGLRILKN